MLQGFRKLVDISIDDPYYLLNLERRLRARRIRYCRQLQRHAGPDHNQKVWRVAVYIRDLFLARLELLEMQQRKPEAASAQKVDVISHD